MVIDGVMEVHVAARRFPACTRCSIRDLQRAPLLVSPSPMNSPSSAIRDSAELLNVHMHQLTRSLFLVANGPRFSDWQAGRLIEMCEERHSVACDLALDRGPRDTQVITDPVWAPAAGEAETNDAMLAPLRRPRGRMMRARRTIGQGIPGAIPCCPFRCRCG